MIDIMDEIHQYVPTWTSTKEVERPESSEKVEVTVDEFHHILMGGDQLTVARSRGSKRVRGNSVRARDRLEGIIPVCEDWHSKGCFITVTLNNLVLMDSSNHSVSFIGYVEAVLQHCFRV